MKRKMMVFGLAASMIAASLTGCSQLFGRPSPGDIQIDVSTAAGDDTEEVSTEAVSTDTDCESMYGDILQQTYDFLAASTDVEPEEQEMGLDEVKRAYSPEEALGMVGYTCRDLNGDGVAELIIAGIAEDESPTPIYEVYTYDGNQAQFVVAGWARSVLYLQADDTMYSYGSGGYAYTTFGICRLTSDTSELDWVDFYFTWPREDDDSELDYYHNSTGVWDPLEADKLDMTQDEFWDTDNSLQHDVLHLDLIPFSEFHPALAPNSAGEVASGIGIYVEYAEDCGDALTNPIDMVISPSDYSRDVVVFPVDGSIGDIKFWSISYQETTADGVDVFSEDAELGGRAFLAADEQLVVALSFPGDMPTTGISFAISGGEVQHFAITQSGYDGSLMLTEYIDCE